jgi:predicted O-methyltransferase YrrM
MVPMNGTAEKVLPGNRPTHFFGKFLYFIVRMAQPEVMVETGVAHGVSSWTILNAMNKNGKGRLLSIDLPDKDLKSYNPGTIQQASGWVVPDSLKGRWELRLGSSRELLPVVLQELESIDLFFHDSDHSYENMHFEFATVLPFISTDGLIISDDVHKNSSFEEFVISNRLKGICFLSKGGAASVR